jgi:hypothetical protein
MAHRPRGWFHLRNVTVILNCNATFSNRGARLEHVASIGAAAASGAWSAAAMPEELWQKRTARLAKARNANAE